MRLVPRPCCHKLVPAGLVPSLYDCVVRVKAVPAGPHWKESVCKEGIPGSWHAPHSDSCRALHTFPACRGVQLQAQGSCLNSLKVCSEPGSLTSVCTTHLMDEMSRQESRGPSSVFLFPTPVGVLKDTDQ